MNTIAESERNSRWNDGIENEATFNYFHGLAFDSISNYLYVADWGNNSIRRIILNERRVETFSGNEKGYLEGSIEEQTHQVMKNLKAILFQIRLLILIYATSKDFNYHHSLLFNSAMIFNSSSFNWFKSFGV